MINQHSNLFANILKKHPNVTVSESGYIHVPVAYFMYFMQNLKNNFGFDYLTNVTGTDYSNCITVTYHLCIAGRPEMLPIAVTINRENPCIPSLVSLWGGANWQEREAHDLLGINFTGHPDLRRILLNDDWEGYPLRKDYKWESMRA